MHPMDTVRARLIVEQTTSGSVSSAAASAAAASEGVVRYNKGALDAIKKTFVHDGVTGFYRGFSIGTTTCLD